MLAKPLLFLKYLKFLTRKFLNNPTLSLTKAPTSGTENWNPFSHPPYQQLHIRVGLRTRAGYENSRLLTLLTTSKQRHFSRNPSSLISFPLAVYLGCSFQFWPNNIQHTANRALVIVPFSGNGLSFHEFQHWIGRNEWPNKKLSPYAIQLVQWLWWDNTFSSHSTILYQHEWFLLVEDNITAITMYMNIAHTKLQVLWNMIFCCVEKSKESFPTCQPIIFGLTQKCNMSKFLSFHIYPVYRCLITFSTSKTSIGSG